MVVSSIGSWNSSASEVSIKVGPAGLESLQWSGTEFLAQAPARFQDLGLVFKGEKSPIFELPAAVSEADKDQIDFRFSWGTASIHYQPVIDGLDLILSLSNDSNRKIEEICWQPLSLVFPAGEQPAGISLESPEKADFHQGPGLWVASYSGGKVALLNDPANEQSGITWTGRDHGSYPAYLWCNQPVFPGVHRQLRVGLRFGTAFRTGRQAGSV